MNQPQDRRELDRLLDAHEEWYQSGQQKGQPLVLKGMDSRRGLS